MGYFPIDPLALLVFQVLFLSLLVSWSPNLAKHMFCFVNISSNVVKTYLLSNGKNEGINKNLNKNLNVWLELEHIFFSIKKKWCFFHSGWALQTWLPPHFPPPPTQQVGRNRGIQRWNISWMRFERPIDSIDTTQDPPILVEIEQLKEVGIQSKELFVECWDTKQDCLADGFSKNEDVSEWPVCSLFDDKQHVGQGLGNWSKSLAVNLKEVELKCSYLNAFILGICNFAWKDTRHLRIELNCLLIWGFNRNIYLEFKCFSQTHFWHVTAST